MTKPTTDEVIIKLVEDKIIKVYQDGLIYNTVKEKYYATGTCFENKTVAFRYKGKTYGSTKTRIVWLAFKGPIPEGFIATRIDSESEIQLSNLQLISHKELSSKNGKEGRLQQRGENCHFARFRDEEVLALRKEYKEKPFILRSKAKELITTHNVLSALLTGVTYSHLPDACKIVNSHQIKGTRAPRDVNIMARARKVKAEIHAKALKSNSDPKEVKLEIAKKRIEAAELAKKSETDRQKELKEAANKILKAHAVKKTPRPKVVKEVKPRVIKEVKPVVNKPVETITNKPIDYSAQREKLRLQREANAERISSNRIETELKAASIEKARKDRLALIKASMEKRNDQTQTSSLSPFKQFAIYHLHNRIGESFQKISLIVRVEDLNLVEIGYKSFKSESYETVKAEMVAKYGRDSLMLTSIRLFEGDYNYEE